MQIGVIVNPAAGRGRGMKIWQKIKHLLHDSNSELHTFFTSGPGTATELARDIQDRGYTRIAVVGGDGTLHEVVNGLNTNCQYILGLIPGGTGNDFSRTIGIPRDPVQAVRVVKEGKVRNVDMAKVNGKIFLNIAGVGIDAQVADEINRNFRRLNGVAAYLLATVKVLRSYRNQEVSFWLDGIPHSQKILLLAVGNGQFYGSGMRIIPSAKIDDGLLTACIIGDVSRKDILITFKKLFSGRHIAHPAVREVFARKIRICSRDPLPVHADGEIIGTLPATFEIAPSALKVLVPQ